MNRATVIAIPMVLAACSGETFTSIRPALELDSGAESAADSDPSDASMVDAGPSADSAVDSTPGVDASSDAPQIPCGNADEVLHGGKCFYLDGTAGTCLQGYTLSSDPALASILQANPSAFKGKNFRTKASYNCCVYTASSPRNYGMVTNCNTSPFAANEPAWGGDACNGITGAAKTDQLTLCERPQ